MASVRLPGIVRRLVAELVVADRERRGSTFADVQRWPEDLRGFEDLAFLFSNTVLAHGVASLRFDEAAFLYRLVRDTDPTTIVEIGRFRGGSTFVFATALRDGVVHSYDVSGANDAQLRDALVRYRLDARVRLHVGDSAHVDPPAAPIDILFVDGDHSEEGARRDHERWSPLVERGGHLLFHDAVPARDFVRPSVPGPEHVTAAIGRDFERVDGAGSIAHFVRR